MSASGVSRFLSKREKGHHHHLLGRHNANKQSTSAPAPPKEPPDNEFNGLFVADKPADKEEDIKVKNLKQKIMRNSGVEIKETHILWALRSNLANGNFDEAYKLLALMQESWEGLIRDYKPTTKLLGAINRQNVTCYLDALLFAMFSRLSSFEAMLYNSFNKPAKERLAMLLRLWVNLLRTGELIPVDITKMLQDTLAECGWEDAACLRQQDTSEAFTFITSQLDLPLLTLKMDIYHTGKEDATDDHKFVNERLLEVAIPEREPDEPQTVTLEDCLETYFNNRIEVRRYMERRGTMSSMRSFDSSKLNAIHVETVELDSPDSLPGTPTASSPRDMLRHRAPSIVQQRFVPDKSEPIPNPMISRVSSDPVTRLRKGSFRKEVMMPAWQFFSLIPWYTDNTPTNDAQVAAHFSTQRPILGMCLKRYGMTNDGKAKRLNTYVDIPVEIGLPHFIHDDKMDDEALLFGSFKLSLQSVVCHRGNSVDSGHYISLVRGTTAYGSEEFEAKASKNWMRFDDLAPERITQIDIHQALKEETPYLLFYQIVPIDGDPGHITDGEKSSIAPSEGVDSGVAMSLSSLSIKDKETALEQAFANRSSLDVARTSNRPSLEIPRGRSPVPGSENRRTSITFFDTEIPFDPSYPPSQSGQSGQSSQVPSRRGSKLEKKGPFSRSNSTFSKLTQRKSREKVVEEVKPVVEPTVPFPSAEGVPEVAIIETTDSNSTTTDPTPAHSTATFAPTQDNKGKAVLSKRDHKREKSKSRIRERLSSSDGKPDRECTVM